MTLGICPPFYPNVSVARKLMFQNYIILYIIRKEIFADETLRKDRFDFEIFCQMLPIYPLAVSEAQKLLITKSIRHYINR